MPNGFPLQDEYPPQTSCQCYLRCTFPIHDLIDFGGRVWPICAEGTLARAYIARIDKLPYSMKAASGSLSEQNQLSEPESRSLSQERNNCGRGGRILHEYEPNLSMRVKCCLLWCINIALSVTVFEAQLASDDGQKKSTVRSHMYPKLHLLSFHHYAT